MLQEYSDIISLLLMMFVLCLSVLLFVAFIKASTRFSFFSKEIKKKKVKNVRLEFLSRSHHNPIITPQSWSWLAGGTFNPAAFCDSQGRFHIIYRAVGADGISRFGYAASVNGFHFDDRVSYPVFAMRSNRPNRFGHAHLRPDPVMYPSGGSWGGAEDPRMVKIGKKIYVTFSAFDSWDSIRMAVVSISEDDFLNKRWAWSEPMLISPPGTVNKNWVLFPEKIEGKYAILHSISPRVEVDYVERLDDLVTGAHVIKSAFSREAAKDRWDTYVRGAGPPPLKTPAGWLVLYHATTSSDPDKYQVGALLLDLKNPDQVIARSPGPVLSPDEWYENDGKPGVVYVCGAVIEKDILYIYYGGGDKYVCAASMPLWSLLDWMINNK